MSKYQKIQSNLFVLISIIAIIYSYFMVDKFATPSILSLILVIAFFGVPHGSLDTLFAKKGFTLTTKIDWLKFVSIYLFISAGILIFWIFLPTTFFITFLFFSALHFSDDIANPKLNQLSLLYGLNIIILPSILYSKELAILYGYIIDINYSRGIVELMRPLAIASLIVTSIATVVIYLNNLFDADKRHLMEIAVMSLLFLSVRPLLAFTIYFCLMHSARHILRAKFYFKSYSNTTLFLTLVIPTCVVVLFCALFILLLPSQKFDENLIKVTFAALAALTFPHAFLLIRVGFLKWLKFNN